MTRINHRIFGKTLAALATATALTLPGIAAAEINLTFGTYAADKPTATITKIRPFLTYLGRELSRILDEEVTISIQVASDYDLGIQNLVKGDVDFARFGPASYVTAKTQEDGIEIIAMESKKGKRTFYGIIAVHEDSDIQTVADLAGRSFAFGNELSTIGRYLSQSLLLDAGINADAVKNYAYLGRHDRVGTAVGKGDYDAGALKESTYKKLVAENVPLRVLSRFDNVTKPWIARAGLDPRIMAAMEQVFLGEINTEVLNTISKSGFLHGTDAHYDVIRQAMVRSRQFGG